VHPLGWAGLIEPLAITKQSALYKLAQRTLVDGPHTSAAGMTKAREVRQRLRKS